MAIRLKIHLENPRPLYAPGDLLQGRVVLTTSNDHAIGTVQVMLFARAKTRLVRSRGQSESVHRGRAVFFSVSQELHEDHFTHKPDTFSWPFTFTIPHHPVAGQLGSNWRPHETFLSSDMSTSTIRLPSTFATSGYGIGHRFRAYTEYYLQATVTEPASSSIFSKRSMTTSIHRFRLLCPHSAPSPITNFDLITLRKGDCFRTLRLLPAYENAKLTLAEKTKSILRPSSLPKYAFTLHITVPRVLQISNPSTIPFYVSLEHNRKDSTILDLHIPPVRLLSCTLAVKSKTSVRANGFWDHYDSTTDTYELCRMPLSHVIPHSTSPDGALGAGQLPTEQLDIGALCLLKLHPGKLTPSFRTYNIAHRHNLIYKLAIECAGDTIKFEAKGDALPITILGPPVCSLDTDGAALSMLPSYDFVDSDNEEEQDHANNWSSGHPNRRSGSGQKGKEMEHGPGAPNEGESEPLPRYKP